MYSRTLGILLIMFIAHPVQAQEVRKAANDYEVPTYHALSWDIHGEDLFYYNDSGELALNIGSDFLSNGQEPSRTYRVYNQLWVPIKMAPGLPEILALAESRPGLSDTSSVGTALRREMDAQHVEATRNPDVGPCKAQLR